MFLRAFKLASPPLLVALAVAGLTLARALNANGHSPGDGQLKSLPTGETALAVDASHTQEATTSGVASGLATAQLDEGNGAATAVDVEAALANDAGAASHGSGNPAPDPTVGSNASLAAAGQAQISAGASIAAGPATVAPSGTFTAGVTTGTAGETNLMAGSLAGSGSSLGANAQVSGTTQTSGTGGAAGTGSSTAAGDATQTRSRIDVETGLSAGVMQTVTADAGAGGAVSGAATASIAGETAAVLSPSPTSVSGGASSSASLAGSLALGLGD